MYVFFFSLRIMLLRREHCKEHLRLCFCLDLRDFCKGEAGRGMGQGCCGCQWASTTKGCLVRACTLAGRATASWNLVGERLIGWLTVPGKGSLPKEGPNKDIWSQGVHI